MRRKSYTRAYTRASITNDKPLKSRAARSTDVVVLSDAHHWGVITAKQWRLGWKRISRELFIRSSNNGVFASKNKESFSHHFSIQSCPSRLNWSSSGSDDPFGAMFIEGTMCMSQFGLVYPNEPRFVVLVHASVSVCVCVWLSFTFRSFAFRQVLIRQ